MNYEINVSMNGKHLFATHPRSLHSDHELLKALDLLLPICAGPDFEISVTHRKEVGAPVTPMAIEQMRQDVNGCTSCGATGGGHTTLCGRTKKK